MATKRSAKQPDDPLEVRMLRVSLSESQWRNLRVLAALEDISVPKFIDRTLDEGVTRLVRKRASEKLLTSGGEI